MRFYSEEHRLLVDLATDQGVDVETLIREALTLGPIDAPAPASHLRLVGGEQVSSTRSWNRDEALPSS